MGITEIIAGSQGFLVMMSTGITSGDMPDGSLLTLLCENVGAPNKTLDKRKVVSGRRTFKNISSKLDMVVSVKNIHIIPTPAEGAITAGQNPWGIALPATTAKKATENLEILLDWCDDYGVGIGANKIYIFAYNQVEEMWVPLGRNTAGVRKRYLKGHPTVPQWESKAGGKRYMVNNFIFEGVNT